MTRPREMAERLLLREGTGQLPVDVIGMLHRIPNLILVNYWEAAKNFHVPEKLLFDTYGHMDAFLLAGGTQPVQRLVCFNPHARHVRTRFSLAHELGHITLRHAAESAQVNREANEFASCLLMPRPIVRLLQQHQLPTDTMCRILRVSNCAMLRTEVECMQHPYDHDPLTPELLRLFAPALEKEGIPCSL